MKKPKIAPFRPEEQAYLKRWKGAKSAPSLWEKRDKDPVYAASQRESLGTSWGVSKTRGPKKGT
jgi:hypothetical protein